MLSCFVIYVYVFIAESRVNLPYHVPEPMKLSQFLKQQKGFVSDLVSTVVLCANLTAK